MVIDKICCKPRLCLIHSLGFSFLLMEKSMTLLPSSLYNIKNSIYNKLAGRLASLTSPLDWFGLASPRARRVGF